MHASSPMHAEDDADSFTTGLSGESWRSSTEAEPLRSKREVELDQLRRLRRLNEQRFLLDQEAQATSSGQELSLSASEKKAVMQQLEDKLRLLDAEEEELQKQMNRLFAHVQIPADGAQARRNKVSRKEGCLRGELKCKGEEEVVERVNAEAEAMTGELKRLLRVLRRETWMTVVVERVEDMPDYTVRLLQRRHSRESPIHRNVAVRVKVDPSLSKLEWRTSDGAVYGILTSSIAAIFCGDAKEASLMGVKAQHIFRLHIVNESTPIQFAASNENLRNDWVTGLAMLHYLLPLNRVDHR